MKGKRLNGIGKQQNKEMQRHNIILVIIIDLDEVLKKMKKRQLCGI